ncbi:AI-2E family transporter [Campylobacter sp. faydin G-140]|uniref:AI-2E family transporter n=1 Tax=Campylobacter anatolicus TaxID=2829105 RepID=UPI001B93A6BA|nr:AI-2E family transporter [Campylobacter anatolicus]MBR8462597.1 AI-2E family transporter [Campylobacter anatolicus]MBR8465709.1 AI-2E family transporter [Campylobacter anatolicus]
MNNSKIFIAFFAFFALALLLYLFKPFLLNIFIAALLAVATSNINIKFLQLTKGRKSLSAALTTAVLFALFIAPFLYTIIELTGYASTFNIAHITNMIEYIKNYDFGLPSSIEFLEPKFKEFITTIDIKSISANIFTNLANIGKLSAKFITDVTFILVFYFFAILYGNELVAYLKSALPMRNDESTMILSEVANVMSVVLYSIIINAILQGILFAFITTLYGYNGILTGVLYAFCSLIPVVGGILAWGPISLYEFTIGNTSVSIVIALYTIIVISVIADTFLKPLVIKFINDKLVKIPTKINELLIFFAMIAGMTTFGVWGLVLGPAIVTFFLSTIKLYVLLKEHEIV